MGFLAFLALIGLFVLFVYFWSTHNRVINAETSVEKQFADLSYLHQSAQSLLDDFVVSIATYGHDEAKAMDRYYGIIEKMVA